MYDDIDIKPCYGGWISIPHWRFIELINLRCTMPYPSAIVRVSLIIKIKTRAYMFFEALTRMEKKIHHNTVDNVFKHLSRDKTSSFLKYAEMRVSI